jgi:RNA polymerase sigma-70 factor (ECF subfamily)
MSDSEDQKHELTEWLDALIRGSDSAVDQLLPAVYDELRSLADGLLLRERPGHTLSATALVHEAYLRLVDQDRTQWKSRAHFLAVAAQMARRVLVDHARGRIREKRGGGFQRLSLSGVELAGSRAQIDVLALHEALEQLANEEPTEAGIVEMRFFGGMTEEEIAAVLKISAPTVRRRWRFAKTWLRRRLASGDTAVG